jgi:membrane associated rhomboid family serine protease
MNPFRATNEYQPLTWIGKYPVFLTLVLIGVHVLSLITASILAASGSGALLRALSFSSTTFLSQPWSVLSYAFLHMPSFWFLLEMAAFLWFGQAVERFLGRRSFISLYLLLIMVPPLAVLLCSFFGFGSFRTIFLAGSNMVHLSILASFALIYPAAEIFFRIQARWIAIAFIGIAVLQYLAGQMWGMLFTLGVSLATAFLCLYFFGVATPVRWVEAVTPKPRTRRPKFKTPPKPPPPEETEELNVDPMESIDPLLDKIRERGLASLSPRERKQLEQARSKLLERTSK